MNLKKYQTLLENAIKLFWETRNSQKDAQSEKEIKDTGNRSSVTGGKQLDGLLKLLYVVATDTGIPEDCIYIKGNQLPGYFRPTKDWDMLIITPSKKLVAVLELKSQVGSFGNNFNNRTEEALGSATDLWTAFREKAFPNQSAPWLGYMMIVEKSEKSTSPVRITQPYFKVFNEFHNTSYLDRYKLFCQKLMLERLYSQTCLIWVTNDHKFGDLEESISMDSFLNSFIGHLTGQLHEFKK
ncbi:PaeR7I family type II restriction endonuclease [Flavobacterium notoginsengisoli]|uniref:PaeR7I family type II restriction endonuclease n=1 Tax=Flavobacterium notoginsengisoli TaxID=1478199 RepID=UPI003626F858